MSLKNIIEKVIQKLLRKWLLKVQLIFTFLWTCKAAWKRFGGTRARTIGRIAIPFIKKYIIPAAADRTGADLNEIAVPQIEEVVTDEKKLRTFAGLGTKTLQKSAGKGKNKSKRRTSRTISRKIR